MAGDNISDPARFAVILNPAVSDFSRYRYSTRQLLTINSPMNKSLLVAWTVVAWCVTGGLVPVNTFATEHWLSPTSNLKAMIKQVAAGDTIVLQDGVWADADLTFDQMCGTSEAPIAIRAQTPGKVVFTGKSRFRFSGVHVVVSGFVFRNCGEISDVMQLRSHSERLAHHCRVTECAFEHTEGNPSAMKSRWLSLYGTHNRVDHCFFEGKVNHGTTLVVWVGEQPGEHRIDHNHFGERPPLGRNGGETIRIGTSDVSERIERSVVENNYFFRCDGEAEIVSNKSCGNVYRHNVFDECSGALTLRHGHACVVDGNVFLGRQKSGTGGVRIIGSDHVVTNNYMEGLRGDAERAALSMMNGVPNSPLDLYSPVRNAIVRYNTFVDCKVTMEFGVGAGQEQSVPPRNCQITHNIMQPGKWELFRFRVRPIGFNWESNFVEPGKKQQDRWAGVTTRTMGLRRDADALMRPTQSERLVVAGTPSVSIDIDGNPRKRACAGCDDPEGPIAPIASPLSTGPAWRLTHDSHGG